MEEAVVKPPSRGGIAAVTERRGRVTPTKLAEVKIREEDRITTGIGELDRVLGGGIVQGSLTLVGGDPGNEIEVLDRKERGC